MALTEKQTIEKMWTARPENSHRVRFFSHLIPVDSLIDDSKIKRFHQVADAFKQTDQYRWVEDNEINLKWMEDDVHYAYSRQVILYADITPEQYTEYALRFFRHKEEWK